MFEDVCDLTHVAKSAQRKNRRLVTINMTGLQRGLRLESTMQNLKVNIVFYRKPVKLEIWKHADLVTDMCFKILGIIENNT